MMDAEDREVIAIWLLKGLAVGVAIVGGAVTLGIAWRLFDLVRG